ncbi:helix-turn-helix domain-containing protein [Streptomyces sp. VTCC 41912]|uniref:helix-turn-helix domain-containing protein n=1 Tax=Streptomyces sp. VTCC 41912 TaxID=3383243 RepID=UPI003896A0B0
MYEFGDCGDRLTGYPEVMTPREVADALRVEVGTVVKWLSQGHIPAFQVGPKRTWRVFKSELYKYIQSNRNSWGVTSE